MKLLAKFSARAAMDGDGVKIRRIADFGNTRFDPYLMIDELKSDDESDYMAGFPPHPHRGIETFTYIRKGGFEHKDQLGNVKQIKAGDVQWMSTGRGVVHSEMPIADSDHGLHGFQIWLNMPAKDKMRAPQYRDSSEQQAQVLTYKNGASLTPLAGDWRFADQPESTVSAIISQSGYDGKLAAQLAGNAAIADVNLAANASAKLNLSQYGAVSIYVYSGAVIATYQGEETRFADGQLLVVDSAELVELVAANDGAGVLVLAGDPINEKIVHMGPFVMNTQQQIQQAIADYESGKFGTID
ncbi:pirin family protein [Shewanella sp. WXL01]|uniref:pirin family protein n=1 Tax=Shewanella sp. WXL01 TaxID=2709721 RepID=UPI0014386662|nr:pirin family protein [Shewanella sp. WXL01]NKF51292.1 pirin family protein [Shewanella sp. WXL01]